MCAAIALAKGVNRVQFAEIVGSAASEDRRAQCGQQSFGQKLSEELAERGLNLGYECEVELPGFSDIHGPEFSRPRLDVLENIAVDRTKVRSVKLALYWRFGEGQQAATAGARLELGKLFGRPRVTQISEDARPGIDVRVHRACRVGP